MPSISIPAAISGVAALGSAVIGSKASHDAASIQANAATLAQHNMMKIYGDTVTRMKPYMRAGERGLDETMDLLGLGKMGMAGIEKALQATPGYQFTLNQGLESVQNSYAAKGLANSGAALKGAASFATGLADTTYEERLQNYLDLAGRGQSAVGTLGSLGTTGAEAAGQFGTSAAAATAGGIVGAANAGSNALGNIAGGVNNAILMQALTSRGMFGGGGEGGTGGGP